MNNAHILARLVVLVTLACTMGGCGGAKQRKAVHMEKGLALLKDGQVEKARLEFTNILQIDPKDVEARCYLGEVLERKQNYREAVSQYLAAIELDPKNIKARLKVGQIYLMAAVPDQTLLQVDAALKIAPENPDVIALRGAAKAKKGDSAGAEQDADTVLRLDPANIPGLALKAPLLAKRGLKDEAIRLVEAGLQRHPAELSLHYVLVEMLGNSNVERVSQLMKSVIALEPDAIRHRIALANYLSNNKKLDDAENVLREAMQAKPLALDAKLSLVEFLASRRSIDVAESEIRKMIAASPDNVSLTLALARLLETGKKPDQAEAVYREILAKKDVKPYGLEARNRLALLLSAQRKLDEAEQLTAAVLKDNPNDQQALLTRGKLALLKGDARTAIGTFRTALKDKPNSTELLRGLARGHLLNKESQLAEDAWKQAQAAVPENLDTYLDMAKYYVSTQRLDEAVKVMDNALRALPDNLTALTILFRLQVAKNDLAGAQRTTEIILKNYPNLPAGYQMSGLMRREQKDFAGSIADFESALDKSPDAIDPLTQIINGWLVQGKPEKALARLDEMLRENPEHFIAANMKGELLLNAKQPEQAEQMFKKAIEINPSWAVAYRGLALANIARNNDEGAIAALRSGLAAAKNPPGLVTDLAQLYSKLGRNDDAIAMYESVLQNNPSDLAANNLAMLLVDHRKDAPSLSRAAQLAETLEKRKNSAYLDTIGWVQHARGETDLAIKTLLEAVAAAPEAGVIHYHLGMAYLAKGDKSAAAEQLEAAAISKQGFAELATSKLELERLRKSP